MQTSAQNTLGRSHGVSFGALLIFVIAIVTAQGPSSLLAQRPDAKTMRLYSEGPLTAADYGPKPADAPEGFGARTESQLRYHVDVQFTTSSTNVICQVKKIELYAIFEPKFSWADPDRIEELLDHEQGHFDITQKNALLAKAAIDAKIALRQMRAAGKSVEDARTALSKKVEAEIAIYAERGVAENKAYDEATRHGALAEQQTEWRKQQAEEIAELLKAASTKAKSSKAKAKQ